MPDPALCRLTARQVVDLLVRREVAPTELIDAAEARIAATDGAVNAMVVRCFERAREHAARLDTSNAGGPGWLAGLPIAVKDLNDVEGVRTTFGSRAFRDNVAVRSCLSVQHLERQGGLVIGKTNSPEFGAGAQTFNEVFGITRNPWDTRLTCAGSSGGSAVALATGQVWLATGSDLGGSLRTPASYCSVVGFRPSPGRVPAGPGPVPLNPYMVNGPMGRTVGDAALMLDATARWSQRDPLSYDAPPRPYVTSVDQPVAPKRVAWAGGFGGVCPIDAEVEDICRRAVQRFAEIGAAVDAAWPDAEGAREAFQVFRGHQMATTHAQLLGTARDLLKPEVVWNIEYGLGLDADDVRRASLHQGRLFARFAAFFDDWDILCIPGAPVPPFPVEQRYVEAINGRRMETYIDWVLGSSIVTVSGCPSICMPCGFTSAGLPVGVQIVAPIRREDLVLSAAKLLEDLLGLSDRTPIDPVVRH